MSSSPEPAPVADRVGGTDRTDRAADIGPRVKALEEASASARGRLDDAVLDSVDEVTHRATERIRLSARHTVVGIAGATGSGKSSTFNAVTGLELSSVGVRRPTTSWAAACTWGSDGVEDLMSWLGIPERHRTSRDSMLDTSRESDEMDGVVLIDLPDHDSTEVSHHLEVDRLVSKTDLLVWVLDPQKYADAAVHERYFKPYAAQQDTILVVLNQIDLVPEGRRAALMSDIRKLLDDDGLPRVPVVAVSARDGEGIAELRTEIVRRVAEKRAMVARLDADLVKAAEELSEASGQAPASEIPPGVGEELRETVTSAAGIPPLVGVVEKVVTERTRRVTSTPPLTWFRRDPLRRVEMDLGEAAPLLTGGKLPEAGLVQRSRLEVAARTAGDRVSEGLLPPWAESVQHAATRNVDPLKTRVDDALASADLRGSVPGWARAIQVVQWLLLLAFVAGIAWGIVDLIGVQGVPSFEVARIPGGFGLAVIAVVLALVLTLVGRIGAPGAGRAAADDARTSLQQATDGAVEEFVLSRVREELGTYEGVRRRIAEARGVTGAPAAAPAAR